MKLKLGIFTAVAACCLAFSAVGAFAAGCDNVTAVGVATTSATPSGMSVRLVNGSGATCASSWANGAEVKFFLANDQNVDRSVAIILTAISLGKPLWVNVSGGTTGSLVDVVNLANK